MSGYCPLVGTRWGFALRVAAPVPIDVNAFSVMFMDPTVGVGALFQQVSLTVVP
jgi:hypothetical protein